MPDTLDDRTTADPSREDPTAVRLVAIVPAYNEEDVIGSVIENTHEYVDEIIVVDDGSTDRTAEIARRRGARVVEHVFNTGVGGAVRTGYRYAIRHDYDYVVQIDADGQHDPAYLPKLIERATENDMVIASRYLNDSYRRFSLVRQLGIRFFTGLVNVLGRIDNTDVTSGYRVYRVSTLQNIMHHSDNHWAVEQTLAAAKRGHRIEEVSVEMPTRSEGDSQFSLDTFVMYPIRMADVVIRVILFR